MRTLEARLTSPLGFVALIAAIMLIWTVAFSGGVAAGNGNGNNGTVKVHNGFEEPASEVRNEPKVCPEFHFHFFFGDPEQTGLWELYSWPDNTLVADGSYDDPDMDGESEAFVSAAPGRYKLFWQGDGDDLWKHKVFEVEDCGTTGGAQG